MADQERDWLACFEIAYVTLIGCLLLVALGIVVGRFIFCMCSSSKSPATEILNPWLTTIGNSWWVLLLVWVPAFYRSMKRVLLYLTIKLKKDEIEISTRAPEAKPKNVQAEIQLPAPQAEEN